MKADLPRSLIRISILAILYFATGEFCVHLSLASDVVSSAIFVPEGIALGAILYFGIGVWPGIFIGEILLTVLNHTPPFACFAIASGNSLQAVVAGIILRRFAKIQTSLSRLSDVAWLVCVTALVRQPISATLGVGSLALSGLIPQEKFWLNWFGWWISNVNADLLIAPVCLTWASKAIFFPHNHKKLEAFLLFLLLSTVTSLVFFIGPTVRIVFFFPLLAWASTRFGPRGSSLAALLIASIGLTSTILGLGPLARETRQASLFDFNVFMSGCALTGLFMSGIFADKIQTESALRRSEQRFRHLVETARDIIFTVGPDLKILTLNPAFEKITGWKVEDWVGKDPSPIYHPDEEVRRVHRLKRLLQGEPMESYEVQVLAKSGEYKTIEFSSTPISENGRIVGVFGTARDITERKRMEAALQKSEEQFRSLYENVPIGVYRATLDGQTLQANPALLKIYGYDSLEDMSAHLFEKDGYAPGFSRMEFRDRLKQGEIVGLEVGWEKKDGTTIFIRENARQIKDSNGNLIVEGTVEDITERKRIENMKDQLISIASHELRSPLAVIGGSLEIAEKDSGLSERTKKLLEMAIRSGDRMLRLINDWLDLDKIESGKMLFEMKPLDVTLFLQHSIDSNRAYAEQLGVKLELQQVVPGAKIIGDADRLLQIITNLLSNACKASPAAATVFVSASRLNDFIRISVTDSGPGVPADFRSQLFEKFSKSGYLKGIKGSGLGLSISKAITEKHGGRIAFDSEPGKGATFYFDLPEFYTS